jgi:hypothetical protein
MNPITVFLSIVCLALVAAGYLYASISVAIAAIVIALPRSKWPTPGKSSSSCAQENCRWNNLPLPQVKTRSDTIGREDFLKSGKTHS